ncbi:hypothetical protein PHYSODRAFT_464626, partial [Phytophthora sojae]
MMRDAAMGYSGRLVDAYKQKDRVLATAEGREEELHAYSESSGQWRFYRTLCQVRFGYLSFLVVMMVLMFSFTLLMEIFFAIFLPSAKYDEYYTVRAVISLVLLPVSDGSLPNFRLALAVVIHYIRHRTELLRRSRTSAVPGGLLHPRGSILLAAKDDPFLDDDKEEEDEAARNRWKRIRAAVKTTLLIKKVKDEGPAIDLSTFVIVDIVCPVLFEVVTAASMVLKFAT